MVQSTYLYIHKAFPSPPLYQQWEIKQKPKWRNIRRVKYKWTRQEVKWDENKGQRKAKHETGRIHSPYGIRCAGRSGGGMVWEKLNKNGTKEEKLKKREIYVYAKHVWWNQSTCNVIHIYTNNTFHQTKSQKVEGERERKGMWPMCVCVWHTHIVVAALPNRTEKENSMDGRQQQQQQQQ